ncbi:uncharacterized protein BO88DRAFT_231235 [Aspergillus vadensis CBS 113365]|uniref:Uncharacterized protein n=1 Tax=Aspergillus vadensis (strain CBS 113365 / IMI 142717 / IBT 24658) TaxID=1448311 RepID=A0A319BKG7_ASPVC|nr:hypothetical protein BO88DRAFT_231235 [Aspergillus vadensis CBS 113365]PYH71480.1 hypothetical protein BO88DRAFT_231235 [Aspergillus vadensis CBS 113365]
MDSRNCEWKSVLFTKKDRNCGELASQRPIYMLATLQTHDAAPPQHGRQFYGPRYTSPHHYVEPLLHTSPDKDVNQHLDRPSHTRNKENCERLWYTVYNLHFGIEVQKYRMLPADSPHGERGSCIVHAVSCLRYIDIKGGLIYVRDGHTGAYSNGVSWLLPVMDDWIEFATAKSRS